MQVYNAHIGTHDFYHVILTTVYADAPARAKVTLGGNAASRFACYWCVQESVRVCGDDEENASRNGCNYPAGYV